MTLRFLSSLVIAATLGLMFTACVDSEQPLSARADAKADPRLAGNWRSKPEGGSEMKLNVAHVTFDEHGIGRAEDLSADGGPKKEPMQFFVTRLANDSFLNVMIPDDHPDKTAPGGFKPYVLLRYRVSDDLKTLQLWWLKPPAIEQAIKDGQIKGKVIKDDHSFGEEVHLQDAAENVIKFLESKPGQEAFQDFATFEKVD